MASNINSTTPIPISAATTQSNHKSQAKNIGQNRKKSRQKHWGREEVPSSSIPVPSSSSGATSSAPLHQHSASVLHPRSDHGGINNPFSFEELAMKMEQQAMRIEQMFSFVTNSFTDIETRLETLERDKRKKDGARSPEFVVTAFLNEIDHFHKLTFKHQSDRETQFLENLYDLYIDLDFALLSKKLNSQTTNIFHQQWFIEFLELIIPLCWDEQKYQNYTYDYSHNKWQVKKNKSKDDYDHQFIMIRELRLRIIPACVEKIKNLYIFNRFLYVEDNRANQDCVATAALLMSFLINRIYVEKEPPKHSSSSKTKEIQEEIDLRGGFFIKMNEELAKIYKPSLEPMEDTSQVFEYFKLDSPIIDSLTIEREILKNTFVKKHFIKLDFNSFVKFPEWQELIRSFNEHFSLLQPHFFPKLDIYAAIIAANGGPGFFGSWGMGSKNFDLIKDYLDPTKMFGVQKDSFEDTLKSLRNNFYVLKELYRLLSPKEIDLHKQDALPRILPAKLELKKKG